MGRFEGLRNAEVFDQGCYLSAPGKYELEILKVLEKDTVRSGKAWIAEMKVLSSTNPNHDPGSRVTWFQKLDDKTVALPAIKEFLYAVIGEDIRDQKTRTRVDKEIGDIAEKAVDGNALKGMKVRCETRQVTTQKNKREFTRHVWSVA